MSAGRRARPPTASAQSLSVGSSRFGDDHLAAHPAMKGALIVVRARLGEGVGEVTALLDRRARVVTLTAKGRRLAERLWKMSEPIRTQMLSGSRMRKLGCWSATSGT